MLYAPTMSASFFFTKKINDCKIETVSLNSANYSWPLRRVGGALMNREMRGKVSYICFSLFLHQNLQINDKIIILTEKNHRILNQLYSSSSITFTYSYSLTCLATSIFPNMFHVKTPTILPFSFSR